jgi:ferredoxin
MACVALCPTDAICVRDEGTVRHMETFQTDLELARCEVCGKPAAPVRLLEYLRARLPEHVPVRALCPACRRSETASCVCDALALKQT